MGQTAAFGDDVPRTIGGYELLAPIGEGGMGRVFLGRRQVVGGVVRHYAIKLLHSNLRADDLVAQQLLDEAKLAAHIAHPNVVQVIDGGEDDGHVFVAMEYVEGVTLARLVRHAIELGRPIPLGIVACVISDALAGLHAAHEAVGDDGMPLGIVHRDFSPQNILVGADGIAKLTDFGIAKAISRIGGTATGIVKGKVSYLSPEQALGHSLDRRSDVWAAGVVLWESLARQRLFNESTDTAALLAIVSGPGARRPSSVWPEVPPAVDDVVLAALERDREARIRDAEELRQRLVHAVGIEHRVAHHVEVSNYVASLVADRRATIEQQVALTISSEESAGPKSAVRSLPRGRLVTLPLDEVPDEDDETVPDGAGGLDFGMTADSEPSPDSVPTAAEGQGSRSRDSVPTAAEGQPARPPTTAAPKRANGAMVALGVSVAVVAIAVLVAFAGQDDVREAEAGLARPAPAIPAPTATIVEVHIVADEPIAQISLGGSHRLLPEPRRAITVPLDREVGETALEIVAIAEDGRKATGALAKGQARIELTFPEPLPEDDEIEPDEPVEPAPKVPAFRPRPRPTGKRKTKKGKPKPDGPGLGPSPYK
jgi:eukaryotic-like serine/threonine-protein kinase